MSNWFLSLSETNPFPPDELGWLVAIAVAILLLLISLRRRADHRQSSPSQAAQRYARQGRDEEKVQGDMEALLVEIQEMARQISAQLDTKFAKLDVLIRDADERIAKLERLTARGSHPALNVTVDDSGVHPETAEIPEGSGPSEAHQQVYGLADAGKTAVEIAQATGLNTGEVELILALRRQSAS